MKSIPKKFVLLLVFYCGSILLVIAQPSISTSVGLNKIKIGEHIQLKIEARLPPQDFYVRWINWPDSLAHFDIINKSKIDSIYTKEKLTKLVQTFTLTSFDSGRWVIPALDVNFNPVSGDSSQTLFSDSIAVEVSFVADSTDTIRDIKPIRDAAYELPLWYWIAGGAVILLLIATGIWIYLVLKKSKKSSPAIPGLTAYQQAMNKLNQIKHLDLSDQANIKFYHSNLTHILKQYLSLKKSIDFSGSTTSDLLILLSRDGMDKQLTAKVSAALRCGNAVKFARFIPAQEEHFTSFIAIQEAIEFTEQTSFQPK